MSENRPESAFALEAEDLARRLDEELLAAERASENAPRAAAVASALKSAHTLKGLASVVGEPAIARACHLLETLLKRIQQEPSTAARLSGLMLEVTSSLCSATQAVREGKPCDELLRPVIGRFEALDEFTPLLAQASPASNVIRPVLPPTGPIPTVRVTDEKLDKMLRLSEQLYYAAGVLQMRQDQLDELCEDFALLLAKSSRRAAPLPQFATWNNLLSRLEEMKAALQRCSYSMQKVSRELEPELGGLRLLSLGAACRPFEHVVRDTAVALGKEVDFEIEDHGVALDRPIIEALREPLLHLIRNALGHGLESPQEREANGKPRRGRLRIVAEPKTNWAELAVEDDGRGIDTARLRQRAAELHLGEPADEAACLALLLRGGLSTAGEVTELSGRGLGLAIVRDRVEQLHGHVTATTNRGLGSRFVVTIPMTLSRMPLLFLALGPNVFGIPADNIQMLLRPNEEQMLAGRLEESVAEAPTNIVFLAHLLDIKQPQTAANPWREAMVLHNGECRVAVMVDALLQQHEAVVKSLGPRLKSAAGYLGGTLLPDGRVALVLNPDYLLTKALGHAQRGSQDVLEQTPRSAMAKRRVLFVEDSGTLRALGKSLLEHAGFDVQAAADGQEALELWKRNGADAVVTDLEMPVMDGLALIRAIRATGPPRVKIAAMSADDTAEKQIAATEAGANAYLLKGPLLKRQLLELLASESCPARPHGACL